MVKPARFGRDYKRISDHFTSQGAECVDLSYARYQDMNWELELHRGKLATFISLLTKKWHFFVEMPTLKILSADVELKSQVLMNQRYVRAVHRGPYQ